MDKIQTMRAKIEENLAALRAILDKADEEERDLTEEETTQYDTLDKETDKLRADLEREEKLVAEEEEAKKRVAKPHMPNFRGGPEPKKEFESIGEFFYAVRFARSDPRLVYEEFEVRAQSMGTGTEGGFAIPEQFRPTLLQVQPQEAVFRPRATVIPAGTPPDAKITMPALDQTAAENIYGGVVVAPVGEGGTKGETDIRLKEVNLEPNEVAGYIVVTDKLLRNWTACEGLLGTQLRKAIIGWEDTQFLTGNGVGRPLGIINAPARINVTRATANTIVFADVAAMYARMKFGGSLIWVASQTTLPQLMTIADGSSKYIFVMDASEAIPASLFGIPVLFADRSPALGSVGDLILCDCSYYMIKDGSGPFVDASPHVYFTSNKTVIKAFWNVDGKPWLSQPIPLEGSTSNTVSPFVVLN